MKRRSRKPIRISHARSVILVMIVRSAAEMGCSVLYSEDLNAGQEYSGVRVENPFRPPDAGHA